LQLQFLGATGTVTGSKYLLRTNSRQVLVDCGLFQGYKQLRLRNWADPPFVPNKLDAIVLTHAHIDHSGYLPVVVKRGFSGTIYCTEATRALAEIMLLDAAHLQEEEADYANRHRFSKHDPALPLYTVDDSRKAVARMRAVKFDGVVEVAAGVHARWHRNGHLLGSAALEIRHAGNTVVFSGDVGRSNDPLMRAPASMSAIDRCDYLVLESTYGNRKHEQLAGEDVLRDVVNRTVARGGNVLIPAFAVGRAQAILLALQRLRQASAIPKVPIFVNSPMARDATEIYRKFASETRLSDREFTALCKLAHFVASAEESKRLVRSKAPSIIVSASGMATGGRVLHHLKELLPDAKNAIVFAGFQAGGTRGAAMISGQDLIKIHGQYFPVRAEVAHIDSMSAHADYTELLDWASKLKHAPKHVYITHGEPDAADAMRLHVQEKLHWSCSVPEYGETVKLAASAQSTREANAQTSREATFDDIR
jgi:metallo-beta-lactamase family protein